MVHRRDVIKAGIAASTLLPLQGRARTRSVRRSDKPNLIHICADDMRFDDYRVMPNLRRMLRDTSIQFDNHFLPFPLCAPSRASILTGLQPHNHGVLGNKIGGYDVYRTLEDNALPVWLTNAGYYVGHVGKFINNYGKIAPKHVPPGYADWRAMASEELNYRHFRLNENGTLVHYGDGAYTTDVFAEKVLSFLSTAPQPYALFFWPNAPHEPATPDEQDKGSFDHVEMPAYPNFNETDVSDKPHYIRKLPLLTKDQIAAIRHMWRKRAECLQAVDRALAALVNALETSGQIGNTHIVFTSDNGFLLGEHRVDEQKDLLYEECLRVPLYWRLPAGNSGSRENPVSNIDVTAAFVELAGAAAGRVLDGTSLVPLLGDRSVPWNTATLTQCTKTSGVATRYYRYMEWPNTGEVELYDMKADPYQLQNVAGQSAYAKIQSDLAKALSALQGCAGDSCAWTGHFPKPPK
ncbi:MAG: sulfatase [Alphaproteobacteria bacterium]|jgi:N-acetylglucosamine-6-sulfatase